MPVICNAERNRETGLREPRRAHGGVVNVGAVASLGTLRRF